MRTIPSLVAVTLAALAVATGCTVSSDQSDDATRDAMSAASMASLALANVGARACGNNSLGGTGYYSSCTGNGGSPEYWCADFVKWVWAKSGANVSGLTAGAGSFYVYGQTHGTLSHTPSVGAAVVYGYAGGG